jgi:asparagine synthase (glutamine-hydrolysing)
MFRLFAASEGNSMCGVCGIVSGTLPEDRIKILIAGMNRIQRHRGPDEDAVYVADRVGIGFDRLAILDLTTGMQPIRSPGDGVTIACNGQVYNYIELRSMMPGQEYATEGDMEVALHLYRRIGTDFLNHLNGMYAGVIYDPGKRRIILFRDRFGIKPMHYALTVDGLFFSSEIAPLLTAPGVNPDPDLDLLPAFFTYRYLPGDRTIYRGVLRLPPASFLEYDLASGEYRITRYWNCRPGEPEMFSDEDEASEEFIRLFRDAVRIRLRSDVEVGSFISGGIDSSAVALLTAEAKPDLKLFTVSFDEPGYDETALVEEFIGQRSTAFLGTSRFTRRCTRDSLSRLPEIVRAIGEPLSLGAVIPTDAVCALASEKVKVVVTGEGADEVFAGYRKFLVEDAFIQYQAGDMQQRKRLAQLYPELAGRRAAGNLDAAGRHIVSEALFSAEELRRLLGSEKAPHVSLPLEGLPDLTGVHPVKAMQAIECRTRLPDYVIARLDRLSMRHSLEARTPFLDFRLAQFAASLPVGFKVRSHLSLDKYICRRAFSKSGVLPEQTAFRPKKPFTMPMAQWLERMDLLPGSIMDIARGDEVNRQGILNPEMARELAAEVSGRGVGPETLRSAADRFFAVLIFTLWYRECIENR